MGDYLVVKTKLFRMELDLNRRIHRISSRSFLHVRIKGEISLQPREGLSREPNYTGTVISDFQLPELLRNKLMLFVSYQACGALLQQPKLDMSPYSGIPYNSENE